MMTFLRQFFKTLIGFYPTIDSGSKEINDQDELARYITSKRWFSRKKNIVKPNAFMPPPNLKLSVFKIDNLSDTEIWNIGLKKVISKMPQPKNLYGRADSVASSFIENNLQVDLDNNPKRHANIIGWPDLKEERKSIAQELAAKASLRLHTS